MPKFTDFVSLSATRKKAPKARKIRPVQPEERISFVLELAALKTDPEIDAIKGDILANRRQWLRADEVGAIFGAKPSSRDFVRGDIKQFGIVEEAISPVDLDFGTLPLSATYAQLKTFSPGLDLNIYEDRKTGKRFIGRKGTLKIPARYKPHVIGFHGVDDREVAKARAKVVGLVSQLPHAETTLYPVQIERIKGANVSAWATMKVGLAFITLDGDVDTYYRQDLALACNAVNQPVPPFFPMSADGTPVAGDANSPSNAENNLDGQWHATCFPAGAHGAFKGANDSNGFPRTFEYAATFKGFTLPDGEVIQLEVVTCSWGSADEGTKQYNARLDRAAAALTMRGLIPPTAAAGDDGADDKQTKPTADSPAGRNGFIGVGGAEAHHNGSQYVDWKVWNDLAAGGGATGGAPDSFSTKLAVEANINPFAFHNSSIVANIAAPVSGPIIFVGGKAMQIGGTSSASPETGVELVGAHQEILALGGTPPRDVIAFLFAHHGTAVFQQVTVQGTNLAATELTGANPNFFAKPTSDFSAPLGLGILIPQEYVKAALAAPALAA
jgi:kumamolisin